ncbi:protein kinase-like domain-containing protein [Artemisia annua]|uniref:Protein kinase-like domain-containing protein n=1 Tax=Artemisia annua TaxID=35608 RepID=A0A2U1MRA3_ARTAN|nr:protein kinase-like domain-containing protein [Artemisia annua]
MNNLEVIIINKLLSREEYAHLRIPLEAIKLATNNFRPENVITVNSYKTEYKGEIIRGGKPLTVRVKLQRLNAIHMGLALRSIHLSSRYEIPNIMSLLGICIEDDKIITVLEHSAYGSLQNYLDNTILTWKNRLNICIGVARAIRYIHDRSRLDFGFTSSSIFLDTKWEAKELEQALTLQLKFEELALLHVDDGVEGIPMVQDDYYKVLDFTFQFDGLSASNFASCLATREIQQKNLEHWIIPSKEIYSATNGFCNDHLIGGGGFGGVYKAKLFHFDVRKYVRINGSQNFSPGGGGFGGYPRRRSTVAIKKLDGRYGQGKREFLQEIEVLSRLMHRNLVSILGFCDHDGDMILVYEHASNGSLDKCINNKRRVYSHTWAQRLQICLDVAHGLSYLHNLGIIHRDIKSANILLGCNLEGVIGDFGLSRTSKHQNVEFSKTNVAGVIGDFGLSRTSKHQNVEFSKTNVAGTPAYIDPKYFRTGELTKQSDIYSFGVVLWEVLCGRLAILPTIRDDQEYLLHLAKRHFMQNKLNLIIDPQLREEFDKSSSNPGNKNLEDSIKTFSAIAYDCLDAKAKQLTMNDVAKELKKAWTFHVTGVEMFSLNTINSATSGFSEEHVIGKGTLGKVYIGTLSVSTQPKVVAIKRLEMAVHGDIKSSHILLDDVWNATISDLIISKCEGTLGYRDPEYQKTGVLTRHSDVYAFGVVLFELLSGRPAIEDVENDRQHTSGRIFNVDPATSEEGKDKDEKVVFLAQLATRCFEDRKLEAIIFHGIKEKADPNSIDIFSAITYQCLQQNKENRPIMARVIEELQKALNSHDEWEWEQKLPRDYNTIIQMSKHPVPSSATKKDLHCLLSSGILLWKENVWLSISMHGVKCEMVPATKFSYGNASSPKWASIRKSSWAIFVEGIEFRPVTVDVVLNKEIKDEKDVQGVYKSESDIHLEEKLGNDYLGVINRSQNNPVYASKEELNALLSEGILIDEGEKLFSVSKVSMKKCYMLSAKSVIFSSPNVKCSIRVPPSQSRFAEAVEILSHYEFRINCSIETKLLSPDTNYGCFLVFQISEKCRGLKGPVKGRNLLPHKNKETNIISFRTPSHVNLQYIKWIPAEREDGWMEVIVWEIHGENEQIGEYIPMDMKLTNFEGSMSGLIVCGIEFRPI